MRFPLLAVLLAALVTRPAAAQAPARQSLAFQTEAPRVETHSAAQLQAAAEVLDAMDMEQSLARSIDATIEMQVASDPSLAPYEDTLRRFFTRYMSWALLRDDYARLYADHFTTAELHEMTAFYHSATGQRVASTLPEIMRESAALGQKAIEGHMDELRTVIAAEARRQSSARKP